MARAFVGPYKVAELQLGQTADSFVVPMDLAFVGTDVRNGGVDQDIVNVSLNFTDTLNVMAGKIVDAVVARATAIGYTVARNGVILIPYQKGS